MRVLAMAALALLLPGCAGWVAPSEPAVQRLSAEDAHVRITELRVRGQTQQLLVQPKGASAPAYEILPENRGHDPSKQRDATGQRVWPVLSF